MLDPEIGKSLAQYARFDEVLLNLYECFGRIVLVPMHEDKPARTPASTFEQTQTANYLRALAQSDIAVYCGSASDGLCAITINDPATLTRLYTDNPALCNTTCLQPSVDMVIFLRIAGFRPRTTPFPGGTWCGEGTVIPVWTRKPFAENGQFKNTEIPKVFKFSDLKWPLEVGRLFIPQMVESQYGSPFREGPKGTVLNYYYWAYYFAHENRAMWCPDDKLFYHRNEETNVWKPMAKGHIRAAMCEFLMQVGRAWANDLLRHPCNRRDLKELMHAFQVVATGALPDSPEALNRFIAERLETHRGTDISVAELHAAFHQFCAGHNHQEVPQARFFIQSRELIEQIHGIVRSNSVFRNQGHVRGYHNLRLKLELASTEVGTGGTGGTGVVAENI